MRLAFLAGLLLLAAFEVANVYFIMPMPGSQRMRSLDLAYALYDWRWVFRALAVVLIVGGLPALWRGGGWRRVAGLVALVPVGAIAWLFNFRMSADAMFLQPRTLTMASAAGNSVAMDRLVVGIEVNGEARAYPLQFIGYHHQVRDTVRGREVLVSYCTVCRTGRVFEPTVDGVVQTFRLVGMDHFNAMLEDRATGSWWRQANGEAVTGPLRGKRLPEIPSRQVTLAQWLALYPSSLIMQPDTTFTAQYAQDYAFERGTSRSRLTGTDPRSWEEKSWVVGIRVGDAARAYDWNALLRVGAINDTLGGRPIVLAVATDSASFYAFERPGVGTTFTVVGDSLVAMSAGSAPIPLLGASRRATVDPPRYAFNGKGSSDTLVPLAASQEFWHSWRTFVPNTSRYPE